MDGNDNPRRNLQAEPTATLERTAALREARTVIEELERNVLSGRDRLLVMNLLEHPPEPNARLRAAIARMRKTTRRATDTGAIRGHRRRGV